MDLRRAFTALLIFVAGVGATAAAEFPLREAKWLAPAARFQSLSSKQQECVDIDAVALDDFYDLMIARSAFQTPLLLGGQAARAGLSCASCHPSGRANKAFLFPGLSGEPGTADVTSSMMSRHRGDFISNPKPIPDLVTDPPKISRDPASPALKAFIRGLIVEEFDGPEPPPAALNGLVVYIRSLRAGACPDRQIVPLSLAGDMNDAKIALSAAVIATGRGDSQSAHLMMGSARTILGKIHERYAGGALSQQRAAIIRLDQRVQQANLRIDTISPAELQFLNKAAKKLHIALIPFEAKSLYNRGMLARALRR